MPRRLAISGFFRRLAKPILTAVITLALSVPVGHAQETPLDMQGLSIEGSDVENQATVVVMYQPHSPGEIGSIRAMTVMLDGKKAASLRAGRYARLNVATGVRQVEIKCGFMCDQPDLTGTIEFDANRTYFLVLNTDFSHRPGERVPGMVTFEFTFSSALRPVSEEEAEGILANSKAVKPR